NSNIFESLRLAFARSQGNPDEIKNREVRLIEAINDFYFAFPVLYFQSEEAIDEILSLESKLAAQTTNLPKLRESFQESEEIYRQDEARVWQALDKLLKERDGRPLAFEAISEKIAAAFIRKYFIHLIIRDIDAGRYRGKSSFVEIDIDPDVRQYLAQLSQRKSLHSAYRFMPYRPK
ncbi:MAG TPA: hypothetical protein VFW62_03735, partial [bacterium]|nr:hypothetical protein [bacterium]